jgi:hypothetical protein
MVLYQRFSTVLYLKLIEIGGTGVSGRFTFWVMKCPWRMLSHFSPGSK